VDGSQGEDYWRERAEQLQHALTSRIVVEQSKGILSERLGLDMEGAFELLRYAARGERMKLHELAQAVVASDETPGPVLRALERHATVLVSAARAERIVQTELFFRAVNDEIAKSNGTGPVLFLCECGNPLCAEKIELTPEAHKRLHAESALFVVVPGHEIPDVETVVERSERYLIVRKDTLDD
jgi:hypothetical protein